MGKFIKDFKEFAMRGNIFDMAIGVIIGGAFGKIVTSMVNDILMPVISIITGGDGYKNLKFIIQPRSLDATGAVVTEEVSVNYGLFIQNIVDFVIVALCIFVALRFMARFKKKVEEAPAPAPKPTNEEVLLTEIRDLLKQQAGKENK